MREALTDQQTWAREKVLLGNYKWEQSMISPEDELANVLLDVGIILVVTASELRQEDLEIIKVSVEPDRIETVWVSADVSPI